MQRNNIYYNKENKEIVRWNMESSERVKVLDLPKNALPVNLEILMAFGQEGEYPLLCVIDQRNQKDRLAPLTDQEIKDREEVAVLSDNTTSIDRVNAFLRKCVAAPPRYTVLEEIIAEELNILYEQNRDPADVAKAINSRVQLYLDEGK